MEKTNFNDQLGKKYQDILGLSDEPMGFVKSQVLSVGWWEINKIWVIEYANKWDLIHELGHIKFNIFPQNGKTFILFSFLTENLDIYKEIISKINSLPRSRVEIFFLI